MAFSIDMTGTRIDRYQITGRLGKGGMGAVYEAEHVALQQRVAIKVLHARFAHEERYRERFLREARSASRIRHRNVVRITDFGETPEGSVYFVMELLEGRDLRAEIRELGKMPWERVKPILLQAVEGLAAAHARDIIHRDVKPANCFLSTEDGVDDLVKLVDFGIAKVGSESQVDAQGKGLTGTGEVFGTVAYMSPEQAAGKELDARSDMYSLGVMAYEMLVGRVPFTGVNSVHVITRHMNDAPEPLRSHVPSIPEAVEALVLKTLEKKRDDRYASMKELAAEIRAIPEAVGQGRSRTIPFWTGAGPRAQRGGGTHGTKQAGDAGDAVDVPVKLRPRAESITAVVASSVSKKVSRSSTDGQDSRQRAPGGGGAAAGASGGSGRADSKSGISVVDTLPKALARPGSEVGAEEVAAPVRRKRTIPAGGLMAPARASVTSPPRGHGSVGAASSVAGALMPDDRNALVPRTNEAAPSVLGRRRSGAASAPVAERGTVWVGREPSTPPCSIAVAPPGSQGASFAPPGVPVLVAATGSGEGHSIGSANHLGAGTTGGSDPSMPPGYVDPSVPPPGSREPSFPLPPWDNEPSSTGPFPRRGDSTTEMGPQRLSNEEPSAITARTVAFVGVLVILVSGLSTLATALFLSMHDEAKASEPTVVAVSGGEPEVPEEEAVMSEDVGITEIGNQEDDTSGPPMDRETDPANPQGRIAEPQPHLEPELHAEVEPEVVVDETDPADTEDEIVLEDEEEDPLEEAVPREGARPTPGPDSSKCQQLRADAAEHTANRSWSALFASTNDRGCWAGVYRTERLRYRVQALLELQRFEECVSTGRRSRDPTVQGDVAKCRKAQAR